MIQTIAKAILFVVELIGFGCISMIIGLWWTTGFTQGSRLTPEMSFIKATSSLIVASVMYYKLIFQPRAYRPLSRFYFYASLGVGASVSYFYGIFHWWL
jgi:hypothetical protein